MSNPVNRREFIHHSAGIAGLGAAALAAPGMARVPANSRVNVLSIGVVGTIGSADRKQVAMHPAVEIVGLCDVDSQAIDKAKNPNYIEGAGYLENSLDEPELEELEFEPSDEEISRK